MDTIWIEALQALDQSEISTHGSSAYPWQALFACRVGVLSHPKWAELRWGFNAGVLFEETLERQRLFLESQYSADPDSGFENPNIRAIALRYTHHDNEHLSITLIGKVSAKTKGQAEASANEYYLALKSTFPYDYSLYPAASRDEFLEITDSELLLGNSGQMDIVQIRRCETLMPLNRHFPYLQGLWQSSGHAHELIWRSLAATQDKTLFNIMLRPTILYDNELEIYSNLASEIANYRSGGNGQKIFDAHKEWCENYIKRRLTPWKKFFYLQFHIASAGGISEDLIRSVGTVLTQNGGGQTLPGYQAVRPPAKHERDWGEKVYNMHLTSPISHLFNPRLSEVADLEEVFAAIRIPYSPPGDTRFGVKYLPIEG